MVTDNNKKCCGPLVVCSPTAYWHIRSWGKKCTYEHLYVHLYVSLYVHSYVLPNLYERLYVLQNLYVRSYVNLYVLSNSYVRSYGQHLTRGFI